MPQGTDRKIKSSYGNKHRLIPANDKESNVETSSLELRAQTAIGKQRVMTSHNTQRRRNQLNKYMEHGQSEKNLLTAKVNNLFATELTEATSAIDMRASYNGVSFKDISKYYGVKNQFKDE